MVDRAAHPTGSTVPVRRASGSLLGLAYGDASGDSDSIACLAGAFLGAAYGLPAWPADWLDRIEYADQLATLGATWD